MLNMKLAESYMKRIDNSLSCLRAIDSRSVEDTLPRLFIRRPQSDDKSLDGHSSQPRRRV